jgi:hypothetical protein
MPREPPVTEGAAAREFFGQIKNRLAHNFFLLLGGLVKGRKYMYLTIQM